MLMRINWAPRFGALALLFLHLASLDLRAQPQPTPGQSGSQKVDAPAQAAATPSDTITVPDGTPLTLQLVSELSSATAKVGDTVQFTTPYPFRINGLVVVPKGTTVSGTVVQVSRPHRPKKNGQVSVTVEKLVLPNGEIAALRLVKSASGKPGSMAMQQKSDGLGLLWLAAPIVPAAWIGVAISPFVKGDERVYPAGTRSLVYFNGPLNLDRAALLMVQPPPYKGPAQVFFDDTSGRLHDNSLFLFCGEVRVGPLSVPLRLVLNAGTYSFTARLDLSDLDFSRNANKKWKERIAKEELESKLKAVPVQFEVLADHQYWIVRDRRGLFVKDPLQHQTEFDIAQNDLPWTDKDFTTSPPQDSCPRVARPAP